MKHQIEKFVQGLLDSTLTDEQQSVVLQSEMEMTGGSNTGDCTNRYAKQCGTINEICINYGTACNKSLNTVSCENKELVLPNSGNCNCPPGTNSSVSCVG